MGKTSWMQIAISILAVIAILAVINSEESVLKPNNNKISYTEFKQLVTDREVSKVVLTGNRLDVTLKDPIDIDQTQNPINQVTLFMLPTDDPSLLPALEAAQVQVFAEPENKTQSHPGFLFYCHGF